MTKKDYIKAAKIAAVMYEAATELPNEYSQARYEGATDAFCRLFRDDNPRFDETKFREACKGK